MSKIVPLEGFGRAEKEYITIIENSTLNFDIVAYATEEELAAAQPKENTIGIVTTTPINGWIFNAAEEPTDPVEGLVWIMTSTTSNVAFNALKENNIQVYPFFAKQYISNTWVGISAKSYQGGVWIDLWNGNLYEAGNEFEGVTGGWEIVPNSTALNANCIKTDQYLQFRITPTSSACFITALPIKLDNFTKLHFQCMNGTNATDIRGGLMTINQSDHFYNNMKTYCTLVNSGIATLDISAIVGKYYICFADYTTSGTYAVNINKIWLE